MSRALGLLALAAALVACGDAGTRRPARVILVSMDTVRADHVSGYDGATTTPQLSRIAEEGVRFDRFYGASTYTIPSTMSILTGLDPAEHGLDSKVTKLSYDAPLLAELMRDAGYRTQAFHEGGYVDGRFGFQRGFEEYREVPRIEAVRDALPDVTAWMRAHADDSYFLFLHTYAAHFPYGGMERYRGEHPERGLPGPAELAELRARTDTASDPRERRRFYALCNYFAERQEDQIRGHIQLMPDFPETPHFELDVEQIRTSYDERIRLVDAALGTLRATLEELGQWEDTLLVVVSDHGEAFFEHGLERHDYVPFEECLRVPAVVSYPRVLREHGARVVHGLAWHLDLVPTILGLVGEEAPAGLKGRDLTPVLLGEEEIDPDRAIFPAVLRPAFRDRLPLRRVALQGTEKWIEGHEHFGDDAGFLFDLARDPGERENLRAERPERFAELERLARGYESLLERRPPLHQVTELEVRGAEDEVEIELSPEELQTLRDLGYVGDDDAR